MNKLLAFFLVALLGVGLPASAQYIKGDPIADIGRKLEIIRYSPDGTLLAGVIDGSTIKVWIANTVTYKPTLETSHKTIHDIVFTADSKHVISAGKDGKIVMWNVELGTKVREFFGHRDEVYALDATYDGAWLASASKDRMVKLWDIETGRELNTFFTHNSPVYDVVFSDDSKLLASAGDDNRVHVRELPWGKVLDNGVIALGDTPSRLMFGAGNYQLFMAAGKGTIQVVDLKKEGAQQIGVLGAGAGQGHTARINDFALSPDGKFLASSDESSKFIVWDLVRNIKMDNNQVSGKLTSITFDPNGKWLCTTGKSENIWDISRWNIVPSTLFRNSLDQAPPQIFINSPSMRGDVKTITGGSITVEGRVFDDNGLHSITLNGNRLDLSSDGSFSTKLSLSFGSNPVKIRATDVNNNVALKEFTVVRESQSEHELVFDVVESTNYLLVIGADKYQAWPALSNAVSDAKAVQKLLQEKYGFAPEHTLTLFDEQVTRKGVYDVFAQLIKQVRPQDNLLVYYSGHGAFDESLGEGYWVPVDAQKGEFGDYFSNQELLKRIGTIKSKHTFLVVDACYSGSLFLDASRGGGYLDKVGNIKSRWGLASGRLEEVADGTAGKRSPFCTRLLEFLEKNEAERFPVSDLVQYVKKQVANDTSQVPDGNRLQGVGDEGGEFIFQLQKPENE